MYVKRVWEGKNSKQPAGLLHSWMQGQSLDGWPALSKPRCPSVVQYIGQLFVMFHARGMIAGEVCRLLLLLLLYLSLLLRL